MYYDVKQYLQTEGATVKIQLSDHFSYGRLLRFTLPSIVMMLYTSVYGVVDGIFVSNYAGKTAFSALNLILPIFWGLDGIWLSIVAAELVALLLTLVFFIKYRKRYHYL